MKTRMSKKCTSSSCFFSSHYHHWDEIQSMWVGLTEKGGTLTESFPNLSDVSHREEFLKSNHKERRLLGSHILLAKRIASYIKPDSDY